MDDLKSDSETEDRFLDVQQSHQAELPIRQDRIASGEAVFIDWEEARERIFAKITG